MTRPRDVRAFTFDCYGTLIDWEQGLLAALRPWLVAGGAAVDDETLLAHFAALEHRLQAERPGQPYPELLAELHARLAARLGLVPDAAAARRFGASVGTWPPFPDSGPALRALGARYLLVAVSNVDRASLARSAAALDVAFDDVVTAEDTGTWKPDPAMLERALARLAARGVRREQVVHVAQSVFHDIVPASRLGLATVWIDRRHGRSGGATPAAEAPVRPTWTVPDLAGLAALVGAGP